MRICVFETGRGSAVCLLIYFAARLTRGRMSYARGRFGRGERCGKVMVMVMVHIRAPVTLTLISINTV